MTRWWQEPSSPDPICLQHLPLEFKSRSASGPGRAVPDATIRPSQGSLLCFEPELEPMHWGPTQTGVWKHGGLRLCYGHGQRRPGANRANGPDPSFQSPNAEPSLPPPEPSDSAKGFLPKPVAPLSVLGFT